MSERDFGPICQGGAHQLELERDRLTVRIIVRCNTEYDAMLLHDQAEAAMKDGHVRLDFYTGNSRT